VSSFVSRALCALAGGAPMCWWLAEFAHKLWRARCAAAINNIIIVITELVRSLSRGKQLAP
jgi:hypothetical protein